MITARKLLRLAFIKDAVFVRFEDGEEFESADNAWNYVREIELSWVAFYDHHKEVLGEVQLMYPGPGSCDPDETIVDYGIKPWTEALVKEAEHGN